VYFVEIKVDKDSLRVELAIDPVVHLGIPVGGVGIPQLNNPAGRPTATAPDPLQVHLAFA